MMMLIEKEGFTEGIRCIVTVTSGSYFICLCIFCRFMPPEDPLGRLGPTLDNFLRKVPAEPAPRPQDCPYGKKCTYGNKCRFYHPERGFAPQKLITDTLKEQADLKLQERATRLSEIAEKAKKSKQKLARTKSLIPWEPLPPALTSQGNTSKSKQEKPKLAHSRSVMLPGKSSDYLNEPRKKLEEAELAGALAKASLQQLPAQISPFGDCERVAKSKSPSPRSSPSPQKDLIKQAVTSVDSLPRTPLPLKSISTMPSRASPSHLTVPKPEPAERYLSGHLYLAKKLSDESVESNFFSEHTSSPSSTRTSSPVVLTSKILEQTQFPAGEASSKTRCEDFSGLFAFPPPSYPSMIHQQQPVYKCQAGNMDFENVPNLSIFEQGVSQYPNCPDTSIRHDMDQSVFTDDMFHKLNPCSPDSGLYTSSESILSPYLQPEHPLSKAYPLFRTEQPSPSSEHLSLRRAFSSTGNFRTPEDLHQKLDRRASGISASCFGDEHLVMKPQTTPAVDKSAMFSFSHLPGLNRQNSSSDPQIHMGVGELKDPQFVVHHSEDPTRNFPEMYMSHSQYSQLQQQRQFENQQQLQRLQQKHQKPEYSSCQLSQPPMGTWVEYPNNTTLGYRSPKDCASQNHYNTFQNPALACRPSHMSYPPAPAGLNVRPPGRLAYITPHMPPPPPHYTQHPTTSPTQPDPTSFSESRRRSFPFPAYPQRYSYDTNSANQILTSCDHPQTFQAGRSPPKQYILPEDTPILPDDPRYIIYYHLSNVFGEQVVRRVMNLNPNERSPDDVCRLIIQYKDKTGL